MTMHLPLPPLTPDDSLTSSRDARREWFDNQQRDHSPLRGMRWPLETLTQKEALEREAVTINIETTAAPLRVFHATIDGETGWWLDASMIDNTPPEWGPYTTQKEAKESRRSYLRSHPEVKSCRKPVS